MKEKQPAAISSGGTSASASNCGDGVNKTLFHSVNSTADQLFSSPVTSTGSSINSSPTLSPTSTNFTIPIEDLRIDDNLIKARHQHKFADETSLSEATARLEHLESIAENQAFLEINLDNKLLENNVELLVYSKSVSKSIFDKLSQNIIPVYLYGIMNNVLSEADLHELSEIKSIINNYPIMFVKIPEADTFLNSMGSSCSSTSPLSTPPPTPLAASSAASSDTTAASLLLNTQQQQQQQQQQPQHNGVGGEMSQQETLKRANSFLKYLHASSQLQQQTATNSSHTFSIFGQLCELRFLNMIPSGNANTADELTSLVIDFSTYLERLSSTSAADASLPGGSASLVSLPQPWSHVPCLAESEFCEKWHLFLPVFCAYLRRYLRSFSIRGTTLIFKFHEYCLSKFINFAYEMARDMMITPKKIEYAKEKEQILFESLNSLASMKQEELRQLINNAIEANHEQILEAARHFEFVDVELVSYDDGTDASPPSPPPPPLDRNRDMSLTVPSPEDQSTESTALATTAAATVASNDVSSSSNSRPVVKSITVKYARDYKKCTNQIQELVINKINSVIGQKLTESVEILKENYLGTLKRCLVTLEEMKILTNESVSSSATSVSDALQQILNAAYQVELNLTGSTSILKVLIQRMKELLRNMPWSASPRLDEDWKVAIASNMLDSLSESKLAKILCNQMRERLKSSHSSFISSLKILETKHNGRLEKTEENQNLIRKILAPKFAKLCLESTSLKDYVMFGFPVLGREIGRGQYGVVYSCAKWGKYENLAVKSVVPPDEKHWNDLALEFHYTKQITEHDKIVKLLGSVIDYTYGNGQSPAVLLIMEAMKRDLYSGLKAGLDLKTRMRLSLDVVDGIRYLHSLGLVHRDIKLKNVLLDCNNRAKITDLGFCKPEAMMSGSIVGTPVHMCPEMFDTKYDSSVDIYAFGILFWYICSSTVALPKNFEQCCSKDDLWTVVKKGVRPERVAAFDDECWNLMELCWKHDPKQRPHIGVVSSILGKINAKYDT